MRIIIADNSCLILYNKINQLQIIENTFEEIVVTDKVVEEYGPVPAWMTVLNDYDYEIYNKLLKNFGPGESSCIALAQKEKDPILIIDDKKAKSLAEELGIECLGSLGLLLVAKREGVIPEIRPILDLINTTNFRVTNKVLELVIKLANED